MTRKFLFAAPLALAASALLATPASAASLYSAKQVKAEITQLDRQVDRLRGLSQREARQLDNRVDQLNALYRSYSRGGFSRAELRDLTSEVDSLKVAIRQQARDNDRHNGPQRGFDDRGPQRGGHDGPQRDHR